MAHLGLDCEKFYTSQCAKYAECHVEMEDLEEKW